MSRSRPEKKREPEAAPETKILPMDLRVGDRLADETGEWEVIGRPYTTAGGKDARVRVQRAGKLGGTEIRIWRAHERVNVKRARRPGGEAMMTDVLLALLAIEIPVVGFVLLREVRNAFAYHFAGLATQLERLATQLDSGGVKVHVVNTPCADDTVDPRGAKGK